MILSEVHSQINMIYILRVLYFNFIKRNTGIHERGPFHFCVTILKQAFSFVVGSEINSNVCNFMDQDQSHVRVYCSNFERWEKQRECVSIRGFVKKPTSSKTRPASFRSFQTHTHTTTNTQKFPFQHSSQYPTETRCHQHSNNDFTSLHTYLELIPKIGFILW